MHPELSMLGDIWYMNQLQLVKNAFPQEKHGLTEEDLRQDRQNYVSCERQEAQVP